jgi:hypothetical protein
MTTGVIFCEVVRNKEAIQRQEAGRTVIARRDIGGSVLACTVKVAVTLTLVADSHPSYVLS